ncbi:extracellular solute-binding protein [Herbiconiux moechotypicola]|uniref:Extracellular solute-binding protein n=1 Tax=Herbiconiux moechotypicola TaxID=637393 RepID=A0ABP5R682_9MICO|nr:extracellular solute-binding protein [Herbiconiux moechotypicola]MCS5732011.1 extracellular solute-binding protein [Herbiconiux moechotypicola]
MVTEMARRTFLGAAGVAALAGIAASWPRLAGWDVPGRSTDELVVAIRGTAANTQARQALVQRFSELHPDIPIRLIAIQGASWNDFFTKILTMIAAGTTPDVVYVATEGLQLFADRLAVPLDDRVRRDAGELTDYFSDVHPALVEANMYQGSLFALPIDWNGAGIFVDTTVIGAAGLEYPEPNWSLEQFVASLRAIKAKAAPGVIPFNWQNGLWGGALPWLMLNDSNFVEAEQSSGGSWLWDSFYAGEPFAAGRGGGYRWRTPTADADRSIEAVKLLGSLVNERLASRPTAGGANNTLGLFASHNVGFTPAGGAWARALSLSGMEKGTFDATLFPQWRTHRHQFGGSGYAVMRSSTKQDAAWEWIKFATTTEAMSMALDTQNTTPARRSLANATRYAGTGPEHWQVFYGLLDDTPDPLPIPAPPQQPALESAVIAQIGTALSGDVAGVVPAMRVLQQRLETILGGAA